MITRLHRYRLARCLAGLLPLAAAACSSSTPPGNDAAQAAGFNVEAASEGANVEDAADSPALPPLNPPAPGMPGGLPLYQKPAVSSPFPESGAPAALDVVEHYYAALKRGDYRNAYLLWDQHGARSGQTLAQFAAGFRQFSDYRANIGQPGAIDAGAGQRYIKVPVQPFVRLRATSAPAYYIGTVTLHRTDIDGADAEARRWRIQAIDLTPVAPR